jgi:hypothetical protein
MLLVGICISIWIDAGTQPVTQQEESNPFGATEELGSDVDLPF